jgi:hypothetical protein
MPVINVGSLKDAIKTALDANNIAVGAPVADLSANMTKRVLKVATIDPRDIKLNATQMPAVCIYAQSKTPRNTSIGPNQLQTKKEAFVLLTLAGLVWNQNFQADIYDDPSARDVERLMENIEEILRGNMQISGCTWQISGDITYHNANFDEQTHFKIAFMDVQFKYFY